MPRLKFYIIFFPTLFVIGCSSVKNDNNALNVVIKDLKTPFSLRPLDSIEVVDFQFLVYDKLLDGYKNQREIAFSNGIQSSGGSFEWVDKKNEWILSDKEIDFMIKQLSKQKKGFWDKREFKKNKKVINLVDFDKFYKPFAMSKEIKERMEKEKFVYFFSKPLFNRSKNVFIIQYETLFLFNSRTTLVYKKEKGIWKQIAGLYPHG